MKKLNCFSYWEFTLKGERWVWDDGRLAEVSKVITENAKREAENAKREAENAKREAENARDVIPQAWQIKVDERNKLNNWKNETAKKAYIKAYAALTGGLSMLHSRPTEASVKFIEAKDNFTIVKEEAEKHEKNKQLALAAKKTAIEDYSKLDDIWQWWENGNPNQEKLRNWKNSNARWIAEAADCLWYEAEDAFNRENYGDAIKLYGETEKQYRFILKESGVDLDKEEKDAANAAMAAANETFKKLPKDWQHKAMTGPTNWSEKDAARTITEGNVSYDRANDLMQKRKFIEAKRLYEEANKKYNEVLGLAALDAKRKANGVWADLEGAWKWGKREELDSWKNVTTKEAAKDGNTAFDKAEVVFKNGDFGLAIQQYNIAETKYKTVTEEAKKIPDKAVDAATPVTPTAPKAPAATPTATKAPSVRPRAAPGVKKAADVADENEINNAIAAMMEDLKKDVADGTVKESDVAKSLKTRLAGILNQYADKSIDYTLNYAGAGGSKLNIKKEPKAAPTYTNLEKLASTIYDAGQADKVKEEKKSGEKLAASARKKFKDAVNKNKDSISAIEANVADALMAMKKEERATLLDKSYKAYGITVKIEGVDAKVVDVDKDEHKTLWASFESQKKPAKPDVASPTLASKPDSAEEDGEGSKM